MRSPWSWSPRARSIQWRPTRSCGAVGLNGSIAAGPLHDLGAVPALDGQARVQGRHDAAVAVEAVEAGEELHPALAGPEPEPVERPRGYMSVMAALV